MPLMVSALCPLSTGTKRIVSPGAACTKFGSKTIVPFSPLFSIWISNSAAPAFAANRAAAPMAMAATILFMVFPFWLVLNVCVAGIFSGVCPPDICAGSNGRSKEAQGRWCEGSGLFGLRAAVAGTTRSRRAVLSVIQQDALGRAVQIFVLPVAQRPEEGKKRSSAHQKGDGNEPREITHEAASASFPARRLAATGFGVSPRSLRALATTRMEESDMAMAAISGVTWPARASGRTVTL